MKPILRINEQIKSIKELLEDDEQNINPDDLSKNFWDDISGDSFTYEFVREHGERLNWKSLVSNNYVDEDLLELFSHKLNVIDWEYITCNYTLSQKFIIKFRKEMEIEFLIKHQKVPVSLIEFWLKHDHTDVSFIVKNQPMTIKLFSFLIDNELNYGFVDKYFLCQETKISEKILIEFPREFQKNIVSKYQTLSEKFIRSQCNNLSWDEISTYQFFTVDFALEMSDYINVDLLETKNEKINKEEFLAREAFIMLRLLKY